MSRKHNYKFSYKDKCVKCGNQLETGDCPDMCRECFPEQEGADLYPNHNLEELDEEYGDRVAKILEGE